MQGSYRPRVEARLQSRSIGRSRSLIMPQKLIHNLAQQKASQWGRIPSTILVQMSSDHESRYPDVPNSARCRWIGSSKKCYRKVLQSTLRLLDEMPKSLTHRGERWCAIEGSNL